MARPRIHIAAEENEQHTALAAALRKEGFAVSFFSTGYPIVEMMDGWPNLFLIDVEVPGINGIEVCKWLKSHDSSRNIPVVLIAAASYLKTLAATAQPDDYLEYPFSIKDLRERIQDLLLTEGLVE